MEREGDAKTEGGMERVSHVWRAGNRGNMGLVGVGGFGCHPAISRSQLICLCFHWTTWFTGPLSWSLCCVCVCVSCVIG